MGLLSFFDVRESEQWYQPGEEFTVDAKDMKAGLKASIKERTGAFGTSMFLDVEVKGRNRQSVKVSGAIAETIRESGKALDTIEVEPSSIVIVALNKTAAADDKVRDKIYRASFSWE